MITVPQGYRAGNLQKAFAALGLFRQALGRQAFFFVKNVFKSEAPIYEPSTYVSARMPEDNSGKINRQYAYNIPKDPLPCHSTYGSPA